MFSCEFSIHSMPDLLLLRATRGEDEVMPVSEWMGIEEDALKLCPEEDLVATNDGSSQSSMISNLNVHNLVGLRCEAMLVSGNNILVSSDDQHTNCNFSLLVGGGERPEGQTR